MAVILTSDTGILTVAFLDNNFFLFGLDKLPHLLVESVFHLFFVPAPSKACQAKIAIERLINS